MALKYHVIMKVTDREGVPVSYPLNDVYSVKNSFNRIEDVKRCVSKGVNKASTKSKIIDVDNLVNNKKRERFEIDSVSTE